MRARGGCIRVTAVSTERATRLSSISEHPARMRSPPRTSCSTTEPLLSERLGANEFVHCRSHNVNDDESMLARESAGMSTTEFAAQRPATSTTQLSVRERDPQRPF